MLRHRAEAISEILGSDMPGALSLSKDLFSSSLIALPKLHETFWLELDDGLSLPNVIVPASGDAEDFFATVATYYQDKSPLSAVVHVLNQETACLIAKRPKASKSRAANHSRSFRLACLGAAIGETTLAGLGAHEIGGALSYAACRRTLAFSLCRMTYLYESVLRADVLAERWARLRKLTGLSVSATAIEAVLLAHSLAQGETSSSSLPRIDAALSKALQVCASGDGCDGDLLMPVLVALYPATTQHLDGLRGAFDGRMAVFTRLVEAIQDNSRGVRMDEIAVAFFCNRILPGSFSHAGVLARLVEFFPAALVWYGFFAALSKPSASQQLSPSLIAKLERDLLDVFSFEQRPRCDISLEELEVLSRTSLRAETVQPSHQRALLVALIPGVNLYTRFGAEGDAAGDRIRRDAEAEKLHARLSQLLEDALYTLKKAEPLNKGRRKGR